MFSKRLWIRICASVMAVVALLLVCVLMLGSMDLKHLGGQGIVERHCQCEVKSMEGSVLNGKVGLIWDEKREPIHIGWSVNPQWDRIGILGWIQSSQNNPSVLRASVQLKVQRGLIVSIPEQHIDVSELLTLGLSTWLQTGVFTQAQLMLAEQNWVYESGQWEILTGTNNMQKPLLHLEVQSAYANTLKMSNFLGAWEAYLEQKVGQMSLMVKSVPMGVGALELQCVLEKQQKWECPWTGSWSIESPLVEKALQIKGIPNHTHKIQGWLRW